MAGLDQLVVGAYLVATLALGVASRWQRGAGGGGYLLAGRRLTLPAFVATMVSTWYGGILGVGEYTFRYGISNWLVFGVPYYLAAAVFALVLARRARESQALTLPEQLGRAYGRGPAAIGAVVVLATTLPAAYLLTLGVLLEAVFGIPLAAGVAGGAAVSVVYLWWGGFRAVVRTDVLQFGLMFLGFVLLVGALLLRHGALPLAPGALPAGHLSWNGGRAVQSILVWYFIALATLTEPAFYQRVFAARSPAVARRGLLLSIGCWIVFDALTTSAGLYARALLTDLPTAQALQAFPRLAVATLPAGLCGLFFVGLLATVMSTVDSYLFLAGSTVGKDLLGLWLERRGATPATDEASRPGTAQGLSERQLRAATRGGLVLSAALAVGLALTSRSVIRLWHGLGTVGTCTLLVPVLGAFLPRLRPSARGALTMMAVSLPLSLTWTLSRAVLGGNEHLLGIEPIYPGLATTAVIWLLDRGLRRRRGTAPS